MKIQRRYDLDWLRLLAILLLLYFHTAMIFAAESDWHIKNNETSELWQEFNFFLSRFRMPLLFFISGVGGYFALRKRTVWQFVKERYNRLLIPLLFGMLIIVPPQVYFERLHNGQQFSSYWAFYKTVFEGVPYPEGSTSWHHLWFIAYLFLYSVLAVPLFMWLRKPGVQAWLSTIPLLTGKFSFYWLLVPTTLIFSGLILKYPQTNDLMHDYAMFPYWFTFFVGGYWVASQSKMWNYIKDKRKLTLAGAMLCIVFINYLRWNEIEPWDVREDYANYWFTYVYLGIYAADAWLWLLVAVGYANRYLTFNSSILNYASQALYPFYILHQTIIVVLAYYVVQIQESILSKFLFVSTLTLMLSLAIFELLIKPFKVSRFLFGMKETKNEKVKAAIVASSISTTNLPVHTAD